MTYLIHPSWPFGPHFTAGDAIRFWQHIHQGPREDCWLWKGELSAGGYGMFDSPGIDRKGNVLMLTWGAYQIAYALTSKVQRHRRPFSLRHICNVPACANPGHIKLGTHAENCCDKSERLAREKKLTLNEAETIWKSRHENENINRLAERYDLSPGTVWKIRTEKYVPVHLRPQTPERKRGKDRPGRKQWRQDKPPFPARKGSDTASAIDCNGLTDPGMTREPTREAPGMTREISQW